MALRQIRKVGEEILRKKSKFVAEINDSIQSLLNDMADTMYASNGVGLAAPQIGILKRLVVIDGGEGLYKMINPVITSSEGEQLSTEGCLSVIGYNGCVKRPKKVTVTYTDPDGEEQTVEAADMLAVIFCHELDHLDGILYIDKAEEVYEIETDRQVKRSKLDVKTVKSKIGAGR